MGRPSISPSPKGYPYKLYIVDYTYVLATSRNDAIKQMGTTNIKTVKILDLIAANGHSQTFHILKNIGDNWVCKEGNIYYAP